MYRLKKFRAHFRLSLGALINYPRFDWPHWSFPAFGLKRVTWWKLLEIKFKKTTTTSHLDSHVISKSQTTWQTTAEKCVPYAWHFQSSRKSQQFNSSSPSPDQIIVRKRPSQATTLVLYCDLSCWYLLDISINCDRTVFWTGKSHVCLFVYFVLFILFYFILF